MPVSVQMPQRKERAPDTFLDDVLKGMSIAQMAYGIYDKNAQQETERLKLAQNAEALAKKEQDQRARDEQNAAIEMVSKGLRKGPSGPEENPESMVYKARQAQIKKYEDESALRKAALELQKKQQEAMQASFSFKQLPEDQKILVEKFSAEKAKLFPIVDQFDQYIKQLEDPNISEKQKIQIGRQSLKLMNSPNNPDAVGAEEVKRIGSYLTAAPDIMGPKGLKIGVDIPGFTEAVKATRERSAGTLQGISNQIDIILGRMAPTPTATPKPQTTQNQTGQGSILQNKANAGSKSPEPKAKQILQDGHIYIWNPATGRYE